MIRNIFHIPEHEDEKTKWLAKTAIKSIGLANKLESHLDRVHAIGLTRTVVDGKLETSTAAMCSYRKDLIFEPVWEQIHETEVLLLKTVWVEPKMRGQGLYRDFIEVLKQFCVTSNLGLQIVCNPFFSSGFDRAFLDYEDFKHTGNREDRDQHAQFLEKQGFDEFNLGLIESDFYALMARCVMHYDSMLPRAFGFNADIFKDSERLADETVEKRMESVRERLRKDPNCFDENGYPKQRMPI